MAAGDRPMLFEVLTGCGTWPASPDNYSSLRSLRFDPGGAGQALYGYGQTIYAVIAFRFAVAEPDRLDLEYLKSPAYQRFAGFPDDGNRCKSLRTELVPGTFGFTEHVTGRSSGFQWRLDLSGSPYPDGLVFPQVRPQPSTAKARAGRRHIWAPLVVLDHCSEGRGGGRAGERQGCGGWHWWLAHARGPWTLVGEPQVPPRQSPTRWLPGKVKDS